MFIADWPAKPTAKATSDTLNATDLNLLRFIGGGSRLRNDVKDPGGGVELLGTVDEIEDLAAVLLDYLHPGLRRGCVGLCPVTVAFRSR